MFSSVGFCSVSTLYQIFTFIFPKGWFFLSCKLFPREWSVSSCSRVECWISFTDTSRHSLVGLISTVSFDDFSPMNCSICFATGFSFSSSGVKENSLIKFSLRVCQVNVSPLASILYHLLGKSSSVVGNKCGHVCSSWYLIRFHSFWKRSTCFVRSSLGWNLVIYAWVVNFYPPNLSIKYIDAIVQLCSWFWWVPHHRATWPVKDSTRLCRRPWSLIFLVT